MEFYIGNNLEKILKISNNTLNDLSNSTGIDIDLLSKIQSNEIMANSSQISKICKELNISTNTLVNLFDTAKPRTRKIFDTFCRLISIILGITTFVLAITFPIIDLRTSIIMLSISITTLGLTTLPIQKSKNKDNK